MGIEYPTLVHFRHFRHFSSLLTIFPSTTVESALQNHLFMQNKPNFQKSQINVSTVITMNYEQRTMNDEIKNKANSKPIQTQFKPNTKPIQTQFKPKQSQFQLSIMILAAAIIFAEFSVLALTRNSKSHKLPVLYFPVVPDRVFEGMN